MVVTDAHPGLAVRLDATLTPDPRRVIVKLFVPGEDAALVRTRASALIERIARLGEDETSHLLSQTLKCFGGPPPRARSSNCAAPPPPATP